MAEEAENTDAPGKTENTSESVSELETSLPDTAPDRIGFGKRLGAFVLDGIFTVIAVGVVGYALKDLFVGLVPVDPNVPDELGGIIAAMTGAAGLCAVLYGLIEGLSGASPGKMILAIKIGTENSMSAERNTLLTRYALKTSSSIIGLLALILSVEILNTIGTVVGLIVFIGCFFALGAAKQALHDKIAHTAVYPEETIP
jgi:uncharacterized RDD family membrane protein YckC